MSETPTTFYAVSLQLELASLGRPAAVTWGMQNVGASRPANELANLVAQNTFTALKPAFDSNVTLGPVTIHGGTPDNPIVGVSDTPTVAGGAAGTGLPPNVAVLVKKATDHGGRRGRGRLFLPWAVETTQLSEAGIIDPTHVTVVQNAVTEWFLNLAEGSIPMFLLHSPGKTTVPAPFEVTGLTVDTRVATQRRRLGR